MKGHLKTLAGLAVTLLLLAWVLRDVSLGTVAHELRRADPLLFLLSIVVTLGTFGFRATRWGILLSPIEPDLPFRPRFAATVIGFAVNNLVPARVGEFARVLALGRISRVPVVAGFATLVIERIFDGLVLVGLLFAAMAGTGFPAVGSIGGIDPGRAAGGVAILMLAVGAGLFALVVAPERCVAVAEAAAARLLPARLRPPALAALRSFLAGLSVLRDGRLFLLSLALALVQWLFGALAYLLAFRAFGITEVPFAGAVFLQSLIALAVAVPSSPGFFGPWEAAARLGLGLWAVAPEKAVSFAVGFHLGGFVPTTLMGMYYLWSLGLSWREMRESETAVEARVEAAEPQHAAHEKGG